MSEQEFANSRKSHELAHMSLGIFAISNCINMRTDGKTEPMARFSTEPIKGEALNKVGNALFTE